MRPGMDKDQLKPGDLVRLRAFGGKRIVRRLVSDRGGTVLICSEDEYQSAKREDRQPQVIGWPAADVLGIEKRESPPPK